MGYAIDESFTGTISGRDGDGEEEDGYDHCSIPFGSTTMYYLVRHCRSRDGRLQLQIREREDISQSNCVHSTLNEGGKAEGKHALIFTLCKLNESIL